MIKIAIVDDHPIIRSGLRVLLESEKDMDIIGEAGNYTDVLTLLAENLPEIVLLDIEIPGRNGFEVLKEIRLLYPQIKVLILSMQPEDQFGLRAIKAGAFGYISKGKTNEELIKALRLVHSGRKYISQEVAEQLAQAVNTRTGKVAHESLSNRELQVLCMITSGKPVAKIADELSLSPATIATYRARILSKLKLRSNVELTAYAIRNQLIV